MSCTRFCGIALLLTIFALGFGVAPVADAALAYRLTDLGYTSDSPAQWCSINNSGQWVALGPALPGPNVRVEPIDINDHGQVAGMFVTGGQLHAFFWDGSGPVRDLGTLGGTYGMAWGLNNLGQVVGESFTATRDLHAFLFTPEAGMVDLNPSDSSLSEAFAINDRGEVVGHANFRVFLYESSTGELIGLGSFGGADSLSEAMDISQVGLITGNCSLPGSNGGNHACLWTARDQVLDLGTLGGRSSSGYALNDSHWVVGVSNLPGNIKSHGFLYDGSTMVDLNDLIDPLSGWELFKPTDINNRGQIVGWGVYQGQNRAFLLTPLPEPATAALMVLGVLVLSWRSSR